MKQKLRSWKDNLNQTFNPDALRVWRHPTLVNAIDVLEVFSFEPGEGKLATSLVLASDQLLNHLERERGDLAHIQSEVLLAIRDRAFEWLKSEVASPAYDPEPSKSTHQIDKALNCALLLLCAQLLRAGLPNQIRKKAYAYLEYMSKQGWPRDDLLPFTVSWLQKPRGLAAEAKQHLLGQIERWRAEVDIRGISFALMRFQTELAERKRDELVATVRAQFVNASLETAEKACALLALSRLDGTADVDLDSIAESLLDELAKDRLVNNEITPTVRLINQFPFSTAGEIAHKVRSLKQREYAPASRIKDVTEEGVLIDLFSPSTDKTWSFALHATQVAFAVYALVATDYYRIVGLPAYYRSQLMESIETSIDLKKERATVIPKKYVPWCNLFAVVITLELGTAFGALIAELSGRNWQNGALAGLALAAVVSAINVYTQEFAIVGIWDWVRKRLGDLLGVLAKK